MKELDLSFFPQVTKQKWIQLTQDQLKGNDPLEELSWHSSGIEQLSPYYDLEDTEQLSDQINFFNQLDSHRWKLYEKIHVHNEKEANRKAIDALMGGCDGIIFHLDKSFDLDALLKSIDPSICDLSFLANESEEEFNKASGIIKSSKFQNCIFESRNHTKSIDQVVDLTKNFKGEKFIHRASFGDFFMEVASVRALRYLLSVRKGTSTIHIHSTIPTHSSEEHQWFLNTTAGLASILGGSHSIDMPTAIGDSRITRNIGNLIRDESGIDKYEDQCGGSYLVEVLTKRIIEGVEKEMDHG